MQNNSSKPLSHLRVAIIATQDFEQSELEEPKKALEEAGASVKILAPEAGKIQGMQHDVKKDFFDVDMTLDKANPDDFDAVLLPGGALNADKLRMDSNAQLFVTTFDQEKKPIAFICHAPWLPVSAGLVKNRELTSYYTIQDDIKNAGGIGKW